MGLLVFLVTVTLTFFIVFGALLFFWIYGSPVYRVERENIVTLLELVVTQQATDNDWQVFVCHPILHDPELGRVQRLCVEISDREYLGTSRRLFTDKGLEELKELLNQLQDGNRH